MRLLVFICLLLATTAVVSSNVRPKRTFTYLKNLLKSAIVESSQINNKPQTVKQEENGYKLFRLPGYNDVMIKVTPKKPVVEKFVYPQAVKQVNLNAFGSVVGTKTKEDTLVAVKEVDNLLSSGILNGGQNNVMKEYVAPMFPSLKKINCVVKENIRPAPVIKTKSVLTEVMENRPFLTEVMENRPFLTEVMENWPVLTEVIENRPVLTEVIENRPILKEVIETKPVLTEVITPPQKTVELDVPFEPIYSYTQMKNNEPMLTYTGHTFPGMEVLETLKMKTEFPMSVKKRIEEATMLAADRLVSGQEIFQHQSPPVVDFTYPREEATSFVQSVKPNWFAPEQQVYQYQTAPVMDFSYPKSMNLLLPNSYFQNSERKEIFPKGFETVSNFGLSPKIEANSYFQNSERKEIFPKGFETVSDFGLSPQRLRPLEDSPVRYNLRPAKVQEINFRPMPLYNNKSLHINENISASKDKVNSQNKKVQVFDNLGEKVDIAHTLGPIPSQYISHQASNSGNVAVTNEKSIKQVNAVPIVASKDSVVNANIPLNVYKTQSNPNTGKVVKESDALRTNAESNFNQYIATHVLIPKRGNSGQVKNVVFTNELTAKPSNVTSPIRFASINSPKLPLRENIQTGLTSPPVIVKGNKGYTYQPTNANGSSLNVKGDKHGVSVNIEKNNNRWRGDIPDQ